mmetsp:Transcript_1777/g.4527  ORF Transcript_1777/g.4527 Transcript_1777/m.4527 type:complete len:278 (+) Transcript_1777:45-878(+)
MRRHWARKGGLQRASGRQLCFERRAPLAARGGRSASSPAKAPLPRPPLSLLPGAPAPSASRARGQRLLQPGRRLQQLGRGGGQGRGRGRSLRGPTVDAVPIDLAGNLGPAALLARPAQVHEGVLAGGHARRDHLVVQRHGLAELLSLDAAVDDVVEGEAIGLDARCPHGVEEVYGLLHPVGGGAGPDQRAVGLAVGDQSVLLHPVEELQGLARQAQDGAGAQRGVERHPVELDPALYHLLVELQRELWPGPLVGEHDAAVGRRGETHAPVSEPHEGP